MKYANPIADFLNKERKDFTKKDLLRYIKNKNVEMINFRYVGSDGRLKTLNFSVSDLNYAARILSAGERVDGSNLFSGIESSSSDLYVVPRYGTAFVNPFSEFCAIDLLCSFFKPDGTQFEGSHDFILKKAAEDFKKSTGYDFYALTEMEYYVIAPKDRLQDKIRPQRSGLYKN